MVAAKASPTGWKTRFRRSADNAANKPADIPVSGRARLSQRVDRVVVVTPCSSVAPSAELFRRESPVPRDLIGNRVALAPGLVCWRSGWDRRTVGGSTNVGVVHLRGRSLVGPH